MENKKIIPYQPNRLPPDSLDLGQIIMQAAEANAQLARYDALLYSSLLNPNIMLSLLRIEEATMSSRIEGTRATFDETLEHDAGMEAASKAKDYDIQEISNYRKALEDGHKALDEGYKITLGIICELHKTLMNSVRGEDQDPGEFRVEQNWIGIRGSDINSASFVPPDPLQLPNYLEEWVSYLDNEKQESLIQTALMHAQFELLHPFKDGNGRVGRILIPLFLYQKKRISTPVFNVSTYLESNRDVYYERLHNISEQNDWEGWVRFFLEAVTAQSKVNIKKLHDVKNLHDEMKGKIQEVTRSQFSQKILDTVFARPSFNAKQFIDESGISKSSAHHLLGRLEENKILEVTRRSYKTKIYKFPPLLNIFRNK